MEDHDDYAFEPIPGLPEKLPRGETMLWQGSPQWRRLAVAAFHIRKVAIYFVLLAGWDLATSVRAGADAASMATHTAWLAGVGAGAVAILCLLAYFYARGTIYTLTSRRIVIRSGLALPVTLNLPLSLIETASATISKDGAGSIALTVVKPNRVAWLVLWPNARPWNLTNPQPMLALPERARLPGRPLRLAASKRRCRPAQRSRPEGEDDEPYSNSGNTGSPEKACDRLRMPDRGDAADGGAGPT